MHFCITAAYKPEALAAILANPNSNRRAAIEALMAAAGGKVVSFYRTIAEGPGVHVIVDADPMMAPAVLATVVASGALQDVRMIRLFTDEETMSIRQKAATLRAAYKPPGQ